jgi:hypothetical protein
MAAEFENFSLLPFLRQGLSDYYGTTRDTIHVSDLIYCQRKQIFKRVQPIAPSNKDINNFSSGHGIHGALQSVVSKYPGEFEKEKEFWLEDIVGRVDLFYLPDGIPIEGKTYRVSPAYIACHTFPVYHLQQTQFYMVMSQSSIGVIIGQYINDFGNFPFKEKVIHLTDGQLKDEKERMLSLRDTFRVALDAQDPSLAPHVAYISALNFMCNACPYAEKCKEMRIAERRKIWNASRH